MAYSFYVRKVKSNSDESNVETKKKIANRGGDQGRWREQQQQEVIAFLGLSQCQ